MADSPSAVLTLTPTARLARALRHTHALNLRAAGHLAWHNPEVLTFHNWIARLSDHWHLANPSTAAPISASQALELWRQAVDHEVFIGQPQVAELAAASWRLIHEYSIVPPAGWPELSLNADSRQFRVWAQRFLKLCRQRALIDPWQFAARLPSLMRSGTMPVPDVIRLAGFELPTTPLQHAILDAAASAGTTIEHASANTGPVELRTLHPCPDPVEELLAAARWARARIEKRADQHLAIVVPDLHARLGLVERIFRQVFDPAGFALQAGGDEPWHISLGPALSRWPVVADALGLLRTDPERISQPQAAALLRSPFLAGFDAEANARATALAALRRNQSYWLTAGQLAWQAAQCGSTALAERVRQWPAARRGQPAKCPPSAWAAHFQEELKSIGFGRGRSLDSREYQVLQRFCDLLEEFSALDLVVDRPLARHQALRRLAERAGTAAFRQRNLGAPVEILGVEEALGSRFDGVWMTSLDDQTWPASTRRDPFIPAGLQTPIPAATSAGSLDRARAELAGLMRTAGTVFGSLSLERDGERRRVTALLKPGRLEEFERSPLVVSAAMEVLAEDRIAPEHPGGELGGGTAVLQRQSDCPFKAFAETRLGALDLAAPRPGLDARARGSLIHQALERFWQGLDGSAALTALAEDDLSARITAACQHALGELTRRNPLLLTATGQAIEAQCLEHSLTDWLAIERRRAPFTVTALERAIELDFAGLRLTGKMDRIDELEGGGSVVIDYKSGDAKASHWLPCSRLVEVQLPAYAASLEPRPAAVAFARLKPDSMGFDGLAEVDSGIPGLRVIGEIKGQSKFAQIESWPALIEDWRHRLENLATDFHAGRAPVDPRDRQVCKHCHLHALCRIHERTGRVDDDDE